MATHSSILAWRIPCAEEPGRLQTMGSQSQTRLKRLSSVYMLSCIQLFVTLWTVALPASLSMGFYRQEYWSGWPFPSSSDPPKPGIELESPILQAGSLPLAPPGKLGETL